MEPDQSPLEYRSSGDAAQDEVPPGRRSLQAWLILCAVWTMGLGVWAAYLAVIALVVIHMLG